MRVRWPVVGRWAVVWAVLSAAGMTLLVQRELGAQREAFEVDARIAHRLLSQRAVEHEAVLATLALLSPGAAAGAERRLPAIHPRILAVLRRDEDAAWGRPELAAAEAESQRLKHAVAEVGKLEQGRFWLVQAARPTSYALEVDVAGMVQQADWPVASGGAVRVLLRHEAATRVVEPGKNGTGPWRFVFAKRLAADSQPFEMVMERTLGWGALPWGRMVAWGVGVASVLGMFGAWLRQREARGRAEELLRLGQVSRLNALGELAAGMAHELNQPLTAVLAGTQAARRVLAEEPPDVELARDAVTQAAEQARRAADVVGRLRRAVERPDVSGHARQVNLGEAVRNALYLIEPDCARHGVVPRVEGEGSVVVLAEPVALEQIIHNLLTNALQALERVTGEERRLTLHLGREGAEGVLRVCDSGPGIPDGEIDRIFEPFYTTRAGGLGLGLSLCETLAAAMGGALSARRGLARGAEFRLTLPWGGEK